MATNSIDLKIVVLGPAGVGKTCVIHRYCNHTFLESTQSTIGAGFFPQTITLKNTEVNMMIWDTAGEERFRSVAPSLLRGANGLILVYDVTSKESLNNIDIYLNMFLDTADCDQATDLPVLLLGNKGDMDRVVSDEMVEDWMSRNNVIHHKIVSAKTGDGVSEAFTSFIETFITKPNESERHINAIQIQPTAPQPEKKSGCC